MFSASLLKICSFEPHYRLETYIETEINRQTETGSERQRDTVVVHVYSFIEPLMANRISLYGSKKENETVSGSNPKSVTLEGL